MKSIYIKEHVCIGCHLCEVYCQVEHSLSNDLIKAFKRESPRPLPRLSVEVRSPVYFAVQCRHCADPPCVYACLTGALHRDPGSGIVNVDGERCIGCWTCILVCPFGAIRQDTYRGKIAKCDFCPEHDIPVCVANCPNEALVYAETENDENKVISIVDYGAGNLRSVVNAITELGYQVKITSSPEDLLNARAVILPGVGAAAATMENLKRLGLVSPICQLIAEDVPFSVSVSGYRFCLPAPRKEAGMSVLVLFQDG